MRSKAWAALAVGVLLAGGARGAAGPGERDLLGAGRLVQPDPDRLREDHRCQGEHVAEGLGEALAQLIAERANPKTDVWFGGTGDPHLQAAEQDLTLEYKSASLPQLHEWAQQQAKQSGYKTVGIYSGPLGFGLQHRAPRQEEDRRAEELGRPAQARIQGRHPGRQPGSSGTAYTMIATLVQLMGEDKAFEYLKGLHRNVSTYTRSGTGADQGGGARRDRGLDQLRPRRAAGEDAGLPAGNGHAFGRHGRRDRLDVDHQGREEPRGGEEVLRMGAHAAGAAVRRGLAPVPAAVEQGDAGRPERARFQEDQADRLRLCEVRRQRRAQAPDRALGRRTSIRCRSERRQRSRKP
jgi:hypothetical protein